MAAPAIALASGTFESKTEQNWPGFRGPGAKGVADSYPMIHSDGARTQLITNG